jgi:mandelate racemase
VIGSVPLVLIDQGVTGRSCIFGCAKLTLAPLVQLIGEIGSDLTGSIPQASVPFQ